MMIKQYILICVAGLILICHQALYIFIGYQSLQKEIDQGNGSSKDSMTAPEIKYLPGSQIFSLGKYFYNKEQYGKVIHVLEMAKINYSSPELYIMLGRSYERLEKYTDAAANFKISSNIEPVRLEPHYLLMKMYLKMDNKNEALKEAYAIKVLSSMRNPSIISFFYLDEALQTISTEEH